MLQKQFHKVGCVLRLVIWSELLCIIWGTIAYRDLGHRKDAPHFTLSHYLKKIIWFQKFSFANDQNLLKKFSGKKYYSNLTRISFSRLWLIRLSHRVGILSKSLSSQWSMSRNWFVSTVWLLGQLLMVTFIWIIFQKYDSEIKARFSPIVTDRPWVRLKPEELWTWTSEKKREKTSRLRILIDRRATEREKKKENYQKDKKGLCFKLSYIFTFKSYWQVMN